MNNSITNVCAKCRRVLKNPISVERGYGPQCYEGVLSYQREHKKPFQDLADKSDFDYRIIGGSDPVLVITDLDRGGMSITNNAEAVISRIASEQGVDIRLLAMPIVYRDSSGIYDGITISRSMNSQCVSSRIPYQTG